MMSDYTCYDIAKMIDLSLLNPTLTVDDMERGFETALEHDVASVCVLPYYLPRCSKALAGSDVYPSTTIGFPHGGHSTEVKLAEVKRALEDGGIELDMVVNISKVLSEDWDYVQEEIQSIVEMTHAGGGKVKVIFENAYLEDKHKIRLCEICGAVNADWVKTSTGYAPSGATTEDLILMRKHAPAHVKVKAAGGVRDLARVLEVRALGVSRFGCTRTREILADCKARLALQET